MSVIKFSSLPEETRQRLVKEKQDFLEHCKADTSYHYLLASTDGKRYFSAIRVTEPWTNDKGGYMPFGGGSHWNIVYGAICLVDVKDPFGEHYLEWHKSPKMVFGVARNGYKIPRRVKTKKEVIEVVKNIGIFGI